MHLILLGCAASLGLGVSPPATPAPSAEKPPQVVDAELGDQRGGDSAAVGNQIMNAATTGNVINGNYTAGGITVSDNALSAFSGLGNIVINTGAQVSVQSGMNITVNLVP
jgi:hypothetical protein